MGIKYRLGLGGILTQKVLKGVDKDENVRYNGGSLSKSTFSTSTKRKGKRGNLLRPLLRLKTILKDSPINNLETIKILKTELVDDFELRLLVKSMHKKVIKGTDSGCLDNQYR